MMVNKTGAYIRSIKIACASFGRAALAFDAAFAQIPSSFTLIVAKRISAPNINVASDCSSLEIPDR